MKAAIKVVATALAFLLLVRIGGVFQFPPSDISTFWPANALLFVILLLSPRRQWLALLAAAYPACFIGEMWAGYAVFNGAIYSFANCGMAACVAYILQRYSSHPFALSSLQNVLLFVFSAAALSVVSGAIGATTVALTVENIVLWDVWQKWSVADFVGFLLVAPVMLAVANRAYREMAAMSRSRQIEGFAFFIVLVASSVLVFGRQEGTVRFASGLNYLPFPLLLWSTLRFGRFVTAVSTSIVCVLAIVFAFGGDGPFSTLTPEENVRSLQIFVTIIVVSLLILSALLQERAKNMAQLREKHKELLAAQDVLEQKVQDRTRELQTILAELKIQSKSLMETREQLLQSQKMEALGVLAGGIAHDFNNILHGICMSAELVKSDMPEQAQTSEDLEMVLKLGTRGAELIKEILMFSRQGDSERQPIHISPVIKEAIKLLRSTLPSTIEIRHDISPDGLRVLGNRTRIHQVVVNLCSNAAYAMRDGGGVLEVTVDAVDLAAEEDRPSGLKPGRHMRLTVKDTGPGIPAETQSRIFEPFFTTKPMGEGSGMGLAVVHGIVQGHDGIITVDSEPGAGACFTVLLPLLANGAEAKAASETADPDGKGRIFFIDDEEDLLTMGKKLLERRGYEVIAFADSTQALEQFRCDPYQCDLVLTDQTMPALTGLQLSRQMHEIRADIPIVLVTGYSEHTKPDKLKEAGIESFLMKPFSSKDLARVIQSSLKPKSAESA